MEHQHQQYTCPMHPEVIKDEPGNCPKCGMNLVPLKETDSKIEADSISPTIDHSKMKMPADKAGFSGGDQLLEISCQPLF